MLTEMVLLLDLQITTGMSFKEREKLAEAIRGREALKGLLSNE